MAEGSYIPLTNEALEDFKEYLKKSVAYAEYRSGSTWYKIPIYKVETLPDGRAAILLCSTIPPRIRLPEFDSITETDSFSPAETKILTKRILKKASSIVIRLNLSSLRANRKE